MEWHIWYLVSAVCSFVCVICLLPVAVRQARCWRQIAANVIGLVLILPLMTLTLTATVYLVSK